MSVIQAILLGILQGITEFLPVSSSGHLLLARSLLGIQEVPVLFDIILHSATLAVVIWVFRARIAAILSALCRRIARRPLPDDRSQLVLALQLAAGTAITGAMGIGLSRLEIRGSPVLVGSLFLVTAAILLLTIGRSGRVSTIRIGWTRPLLLGAAQGLGVLPGISRSGITIGSGLLCGLDRRAAGEFSFLLSIPAVVGALLFSLGDSGELLAAVPPISLAAGFLAALASGYGAIRALLRIITSGRLWIFAVYLVPAGIWTILRFTG